MHGLLRSCFCSKWSADGGYRVPGFHTSPLGACLRELVLVAATAGVHIVSATRHFYWLNIHYANKICSKGSADVLSLGAALRRHYNHTRYAVSIGASLTSGSSISNKLTGSLRSSQHPAPPSLKSEDDDHYLHTIYGAPFQ